MGLPEKYIIAQVGHSSASITKAVYDHINSERQSEYASDIANLVEFLAESPQKFSLVLCDEAHKMRNHIPSNSQVLLLQV